METERGLKMEEIACEFDGKIFFSGTEVCDAVRCIVCKSGKWAVTWVSPFGP